jgi:hypothetical protein
MHSFSPSHPDYHHPMALFFSDFDLHWMDVLVILFSIINYY